MPPDDPVDGRVVGKFAEEFDVVVDVVVDEPVEDPPELPVDPVDPVDPLVEPEPSWPHPAVAVPEQVAPPPVSGAADGVGSAANAGAEKTTGPAMTHIPTRLAAMRCFIPPPISFPTTSLIRETPPVTSVTLG